MERPCQPVISNPSCAAICVIASMPRPMSLAAALSASRRRRRNSSSFLSRSMNCSIVNLLIPLVPSVLSCHCGAASYVSMRAGHVQAGREDGGYEPAVFVEQGKPYASGSLKQARNVFEAVASLCLFAFETLRFESGSCLEPAVPTAFSRRHPEDCRTSESPAAE